MKVRSQESEVRREAKGLRLKTEERQTKETTCSLQPSALSLILLFTVYCSLFTILPGCGKKAPPKPPQETTWVR